MAKLRSPSYPGITLEVAIARAKAFYRAENKHEAVVATAVGHWKYGPKSSGGLVTISALKAYGLMEDRGAGEDRKVRLTPLGLSIVQDDRIVSPERDDAIRKAALSPQVMRDLWDLYALELPSTDTVAHYLRVEKGFTPSAALDFIKIYNAAISYASLNLDSSPVVTDEEEGDASELQSAFEDDTGSASPIQPHHQLPVMAPALRGAKFSIAADEEEIANIRVSRATTIRLIASGPYSRQSIEALVAQLKLGLDLGTYDDV